MPTIFDDFQQAIADSTYSLRQSVYTTWSDATKDWQNPLIIVQETLETQYKVVKQQINLEEQVHMVPAFW